jgi:uncharacterized RDD family membrane protein YckC
MFTIIGGDGKEYGPATAEQIRSWITAGRANLETKARQTGSDDFKRLGDYPEFGGGSATPPPLGSAPGSSIPELNISGAPRPHPGRRLAARAIDWFIAAIALAPGLSIIGPEISKIIIELASGQTPSIDNLDSATIARGTLLVLSGWLIVLAIQIVLLSRRGQSIGKLVLGLRVIQISTGAQAGFVHAWFLRECCITIIGTVLGLIPFMGMMLRPAFHVTDWCLIFRGDQRCLHDLIAGTAVVNA